MHKKILILFFITLGLVGCAASPSQPDMAAVNARLAAMESPEPIYGSTGEYMSPFTEDNTVAPWVEKGMTAAAASNVGATAGAYAGQKALEQVPFIGGWLGGKAGKAAGREIAIQAAGGWEFIKSSSDLSFNSLDDLALYLQKNNSGHPQYTEVLEATYGIYPDLRQSMIGILSLR